MQKVAISYYHEEIHKNTYLAKAISEKNAFPHGTWYKV